MEKLEFSYENIGFDELQTVCVWCKASGLSNEKSSVPLTQIWGIDKNTGGIVCKKCIESILERKNSITVNLSPVNII